MQASDEVKARLHHITHELRQTQQLLAAAADHTQTASDDIQVCNDLVPGLTEEMDRVYALRGDETYLGLRQENAKLRRDFAVLQHDYHQEKQFSQLLQSGIKEVQEKYENAIIEVADLKDEIKTLRDIPAFNVVGNTAVSGDANGVKSPGLIPFGRTVVETNRGLTVTIESSPAASPDKAILTHGWIAPVPIGAAFPFPDIVPQPRFTSLDHPANKGSIQVVIRAPDKPFMKGTKESNESFERMKRALNLADVNVSTNVINADNNTSISAPAMPTSNPLNPVTPSQAKSKLNPTIAAFTPSNSSGKDSADSGMAKNSSPTEDETKPSAAAATTQEEGFIPPHLGLVSKDSTDEKPVITTEEGLNVEHHIESWGTVATSAHNESSKEAELVELVQNLSLKPRTLPHLRHLNNPTKNEDPFSSPVQPSGKGKNKEDTFNRVDLSPYLTSKKENVQPATTRSTIATPDPDFEAWLDIQEKNQAQKTSSQEPASMTNGWLIEIDPESPQKGKMKAANLPPGFTPFSAKDDDRTKTEPAAPIKTYGPDFPTAEKEESAAEHKTLTKPTTEKERNAAFLAEYIEKLNALGQKYGRDSRDSSEEKENEIVVATDYNPPKPNGSHELGALLDEECIKMILKPRAVKVEGVTGYEWKAIRKDGKVFYVL